MSYTRTTTLDPAPSGDTTKTAIVNKLDVDLSGAFTNLNTHEALTTGVHGVGTASVASTTTVQTLTNKTLQAPTLTGTVTASGATITGGNTVNQTLTTPTITGGGSTNMTLTTPTVTGGSTTNQTLTTPIITGGTGTNMTLLTPTLTGAIPASGATISGATITGGTHSGLTLSPQTTGFTIAGGTASKTLTVDSTVSTSNFATKTGTTTNDDAAAGEIGEFKDSLVSGNVDATATNITSLVLTAGDWDASAALTVNGAQNNTIVALGISSTSGAYTGTFGKDKMMGAVIAAASQGGIAIPRLRLSLAATTTYYLVGSFNVTTDAVSAYMSARRMR